MCDVVVTSSLLQAINLCPLCRVTRHRNRDRENVGSRCNGIILCKCDVFTDIAHQINVYSIW